MYPTAEERSIQRKSTAGPIFGSGSLFDRKTLESTFGLRMNAQSSVKIRTPSGILPIPIMHGTNENVVEEVNGNLNVLGKIVSKKEILCCNYTEDYKYIVTGSVDGIVRMYDSRSKYLAFEFADDDITKVKTLVTSIKYRPVNNGHPQTNSLLCTYTNGFLKCWNYMYDKCLYTIQEKRHTLGLSYHKYLPKIITYGDDRKLNLYDEETRVLERVFGSSDSSVQHGHSSRVFTAQFHPQLLHVILSAGWDDVIQFWDTRMPNPLRQIMGPRICGDGLEIIPSTNQILTYSWRKNSQIELWDFDSGNLIMTIEPDNFPSSLYFGKTLNKHFIVTGGADPNLLRLIDKNSNSTIATFRGLPGGIYCMGIGNRREMGRDTISRLSAPESSLPRIIICAGKRIYELDFGL